MSVIAQQQVLATPDTLDGEEYHLRRQAFLDCCGWGEAQMQAMPYDASFRRYYRLVGGPKPALLMDALLDVTEPIEDFIKVDQHLRKLGFSAPEIYETDLNEKLAIIEDFGEGVFNRLLDAGAEPKSLYELATDVLIELHQHPKATDLDLRQYTLENWREEITRYLDWFFPAQMGEAVPPQARESFIALWDEYWDLFKSVPDNFVFRDFFPDNLMLLEDRKGLEACGVLDFQIACVAPISFDLVGLLEDARREVPEDIRQAMIARYLAANPQIDEQNFKTSYSVFSAHRNIRILGNFARLFVRDGKDKYLAFVPHVQKLVAGYLEKPELSRLRDWFSQYGVDITKALPEEINKEKGFDL